MILVRKTTCGCTKLLSVLFCVFIFQALKAQENKVSITGYVFEKSGSNVIPLHLATAQFFSKSDSTKPLASVFTDSTGLFNVSLPASDAYLVSVSMIGYKKAVREINAQQTAQQPVRIYLEADKTVLTAVAVTARRPLIEQRLDRLVINVGNSILGENSTAFELLQRAPGVYIDQSNNISLKGKPGATVMIDGRPVYLSSSEVANLLKNTQGSTIERIELIVNPSAKYDAAGTGGLINIVTKRARKPGVNGSVTAGAGVGVYPKVNGGGNLSYKSKSFNAYTNLSYTENKFPHDFTNDRKVTEPGGIRNIIQETDIIKRSHSFNARAGLDYFINKKTTLGFLVNHNRTWYRADFVGDSRIEKNRAFLESLQRNAVTQSSSYITTGNVNFRRLLKKEGEELNIDADITEYRSDARVNYKVQSLKSTESKEFIFRNISPIDIGIRTFRADYTLPLKKIQLDAGLKQSFIRTDNNFLFDSLLHNNWKTDTSKTNRFIYKEAISAAYVNMVKQIDSTWSIQAGLRAEYTHSNGNSITLDSVITRNYVSLFPSLFINKQLSPRHQLSFSYSRRINRPNYADLNPFVFYVDQYDVTQGNPYLKPAYIHNFELSWLFNNRFNISGGYSNTKNQFQKVVIQDTATRIATELNENLDRYHNYYLSAALPFDIKKWWESFYYVNLSYKDYTSSIANNNGWTIQLYTENNFQLPRNFSAQLSYNFFYAQAYGLYRSKPVSYIDFSMRKGFKNNKFALNFRVTDIFRMNKTTTYIRYNDIDQTTVNFYEGRIFRLSFTYRIGSKASTQRERKTSSKDEQNRISAN